MVDSSTYSEGSEMEVRDTLFNEPEQANRMKPRWRERSKEFIHFLRVVDVYLHKLIKVGLIQIVYLFFRAICHASHIFVASITMPIISE